MLIYSQANNLHKVYSMKEIALASSNEGKIKEFTNILNQKNIKIIPQTDFNVPNADEFGLSFIENAVLKVRNCEHTRSSCDC